VARSALPDGVLQSSDADGLASHLEELSAAQSQIEEAQLSLSQSKKEIASLQRSSANRKEAKDSLLRKLAESASLARALQTQLAEELALRQEVQAKVIARDRQLCELQARQAREGDLLSKSVPASTWSSSEDSKSSTVEVEVSICQLEGDTGKALTCSTASSTSQLNRDALISSANIRGDRELQTPWTKRPGLSSQQIQRDLPAFWTPSASPQQIYRDVPPSWAATLGVSPKQVYREVLSSLASLTTSVGVSPVQRFREVPSSRGFIGAGSPEQRYRPVLTSRTNISGNGSERPCGDSQSSWAYRGGLSPMQVCREVRTSSIGNARAGAPQLRRELQKSQPAGAGDKQQLHSSVKKGPRAATPCHPHHLVSHHVTSPLRLHAHP